MEVTVAAVTGRSAAASAWTPAPETDVVGEMIARIERNESFWTVVRDPFMKRDIVRDDVREVVRWGLMKAHGDYETVRVLFNLKRNEHRRFIGFLQRYHCLVPGEDFRQPAVGAKTSVH
jgi:putative SOS response-associated peptidase YedK